MHAHAWVVLWGLAAANGAHRNVVLVTSPSIDGARLADAMKAYVGDDVTVTTAPAEPGQALEQTLAETRRAGEDVHALIAVRVVGSDGAVEIQIVDRVTEKILIASIARPPPLVDLYRVIALKVQALLRSTLAETPEVVRDRPELARLATGAAPVEEETAGARRLSLATGYALMSFPLGSYTQQGASLSVGYVLGAPQDRLRLEVSVAAAALRSWQALSGGAVVTADDVPIQIGLGLRRDGRRLAALVGLVGQVALMDVTTTNGATTRARRSLLLGAGIVGEGRWRLGSTTWLYARAAALAMVVGDRYRVAGVEIADVTGLQVQGSGGVGVSIW